MLKYLNVTKPNNFVMLSKNWVYDGSTVIGFPFIMRYLARGTYTDSELAD